MQPVLLPSFALSFVPLYVASRRFFFTGTHASVDPLRIYFSVRENSVLNSRGMLDLSTDNRDTRVLGIYICAGARMCVAGETIKCRKETRVLCRIDFCMVPPPLPPPLSNRLSHIVCTYVYVLAVVDDASVHLGLFARANRARGIRTLHKLNRNLTSPYNYAQIEAILLSCNRGVKQHRLLSEGN